MVWSDIIVPVERSAQVVMARCADCLVFWPLLAREPFLVCFFLLGMDLLSYRIRDALLWWKIFVKAVHWMNWTHVAGCP